MSLIPYDQISAFRLGAWQAHWIGPTPIGEPPPLVGIAEELPRQPFGRVLFRRSVRLESLPERVPLRLTADSRYLLVINGAEVGRGPIRSQPRRLRYDEYDVADHLVRGENTVAVLVTYYGRPNALWQPAVGNGVLGTDALLVLEAQLDDKLLLSDDRWRVWRSPAWSTFASDSLHGVPVECFDAREHDPAWIQGSYDDSGWEQATILHTSHIGGFARSQPPTDPYGALLPRQISALTGQTIEATKVLDASVRTLPPGRPDLPADRAVQVLTAEAPPFLSGVPAEDGPGLPVHADLTADQLLHVAVDFGRIVAGFVELDLDVPAGTVVDLAYRESPWGYGPADGPSAPKTGGRYIARGQDDRYRSLELNGLRYLHVLVSPPAGTGAVTAGVSAARVREYHYPQAGESSFESDDPELDALYRAGIRTVTMNAFDAFTDCPTREQRAWVGDGVVHQMVHLTTNTDWGLARNYVRLGDSPRPDGMLPMSVAGDVEHGGSITIPDWALHWVHGVFNLYRYVGDRGEIQQYLPTVEKVLRWYLPYVDDRGTISEVPEWNLVDWSSVFSTGRSSILTALWARGLAELAELADWVGNGGTAEWARQHYDAAAVGFEDFWDPSRGLYVDHIIAGEQRPAASQAAGASAIVSGLAPPERWSGVATAITDESRVVTRSWIGGDGGYDLQKILDQARGVQTVDWDVDHQIVRAEPFFSYVVHDAVAAAGLADRLPQLVRRWSRFLSDGYDTFGECWGWGTPVHGWSSTPTRDLVSYVAGIQPDAPGYARARITPALGGLQRLQVSTPTPYGQLRMRIAEGRADVVSPVPYIFVGSQGEVQRPAGATTGLLL